MDAGDASWSFALPEPTVTHTPAASGDEVSVTVPLTGEGVFDDYIRWSDDYSLGSLFDANGEEQVLSLVDLNNAGPPGLVRISITGTDNRFTPEFEATGRFTFTASDGESVTVVLANADMTEIYQWTPTNSAEVVAFVLHVKSLTDQTGTLTLTGEGTATTADHAVDAGNVGWAFDLPQPIVTHTSVLPTDHAVDAGDASWAFTLPQPTVTHTPASSASVTVALTGFVQQINAIQWQDDVGIGSNWSPSGDNQTLELVTITVTGGVQLAVRFNENRFTAAFEATGRFIFTASDGETVEVVGTGGDMTEPYGWEPTNAAEVATFYTHVQGLTDQDATLTLTDDPPGPRDHAVNAGAASWAFDLPDPSITHMAGPRDHAVDAGAATWAFDLPEPAVTYTSSSYETVTVIW